MEEVLIEKIGVCHWRLARVLRCETGSIRTRMDRIGSFMDPDEDEIPGIEAEIAAAVETLPPEEVEATDAASTKTPEAAETTDQAKD